MTVTLPPSVTARITDLGKAILDGRITEDSTPEHRALAYMAGLLHDDRVSLELKIEIAAALAPVFHPVVGRPVH